MHKIKQKTGAELREPTFKSLGFCCFSIRIWMRGNLLSVGTVTWLNDCLASTHVFIFPFEDDNYANSPAGAMNWWVGFIK